MAKNGPFPSKTKVVHLKPSKTMLALLDRVQKAEEERDAANKAMLEAKAEIARWTGCGSAMQTQEAALNRTQNLLIESHKALIEAVHIIHTSRCR